MYYYTKTKKWYFKQKILRYKLNYTDWNNITSFFKPINHGTNQTSFICLL